jgi:hypothetical protein
MPNDDEQIKLLSEMRDLLREQTEMGRETTALVKSQCARNKAILSFMAVLLAALVAVGIWMLLSLRARGLEAFTRAESQNNAVTQDAHKLLQQSRKRLEQGRESKIHGSD